MQTDGKMNRMFLGVLVQVRNCSNRRNRSDGGTQQFKLFPSAQLRHPERKDGDGAPPCLAQHSG